MAAGELDQRITLQSLALVSDGGGGSTETWSNVAILWAKVVPMSGRERLQADQLESPANYRVTIRRRTDITAGKRILWQGKPLNIRFDGFNSPRDLYMTFDAEMGVQT
jgi:SPP1 family predicted phage head-tail adaptor